MANIEKNQTDKPEFAGKWVRLGDVLTEYKELNAGSAYRPVAIGRYGIRFREDIYTKELARDYSKNKVIRRNTLTVGMGSKQIDIGILTDDACYSVSPAYHTYRISGVSCDYLRYCLEARNADMFKRFAKRGTRQGKTIDLKRWLTYSIPLPSEEEQGLVVKNLDAVEAQVNNLNAVLRHLDDLVKSEFVEMFGDPVGNVSPWEKKPLGITCRVLTGNTPPRDNPVNYGTYIEWCKTDNITNEKYLTRAMEGLSEQGAARGRVAPAGSILMACIAGSLNSIGKVAVANRPVSFNQQINAIIPGEELLPDYLLWALKLSKSYLCLGVNMQLKGILNKRTLSAKEYAVPPLALQRQFADFVAEVDKLVFAPSNNFLLNLFATIHDRVEKSGHFRKFILFSALIFGCLPCRAAIEYPAL